MPPPKKSEAYPGRELMTNCRFAGIGFEIFNSSIMWQKCKDRLCPIVVLNCTVVSIAVLTSNTRAFADYFN